eukprot:scaffold2750_cov114-Skeletonema_dohrnii-CCMP3373.AAC.1
MRGRRPGKIDFSCVGLSSGSTYPHLPDTRQNRAGMGISMPVSTRSKIRTGSTRYLPYPPRVSSDGYILNPTRVSSLMYLATDRFRRTGTTDICLRDDECWGIEKNLLLVFMKRETLIA